MCDEIMREVLITSCFLVPLVALLAYSVGRQQGRDKLMHEWRMEGHRILLNDAKLIAAAKRGKAKTKTY